MKTLKALLVSACPSGRPPSIHCLIKGYLKKQTSSLKTMYTVDNAGRVELSPLFVETYPYFLTKTRGQHFASDKC